MPPAEQHSPLGQRESRAGGRGAPVQWVRTERYMIDNGKANDQMIENCGYSGEFWLLMRAAAGLRLADVGPAIIAA
jgi:hypothetical protein